MKDKILEQKLASLDWANISANMNQKGYALLPKILPDEYCSGMIRDYENPSLYRKTIQMERFRFGSGEYKYFDYPLPAAIDTLRNSLYPFLAPIANGWMHSLGLERQFPSHLERLHELCREHNQTKATVLILKYGTGGHNTMHQDLYGEIFFPMQAVLFLNEPFIDYEGGAFVLLEQKPRPQSKAIVLQPAKGDMLIFTTQFRPVKGSKAYYRVNMKHGVSEVLSGNRHTLGIIFHDAL